MKRIHNKSDEKKKSFCAKRNVYYVEQTLKWLRFIEFDIKTAKPPTLARTQLDKGLSPRSAITHLNEMLQARDYAVFVHWLCCHNCGIQIVLSSVI